MERSKSRPSGWSRVIITSSLCMWGKRSCASLAYGSTCLLKRNFVRVLLCFGFVRGAVFVKQASGMVRTAVDATTTTLGVFVKSLMPVWITRVKTKESV
ncbi:hypothetical protein CesoFtcFv8_020896 [Champsocephalus esox]|uniref:Uncharacterized protein n=1 Tax=Champsocephalus esox TaxID=159716 RepID=A0AAN8BBS9_9TELE|nr:hypothetical protein CesoFtcFv8_020896 [Champsocephalus esox]